MQRCSICGIQLTDDWPRNSLPLRSDLGTRCCAECDELFVLPARLLRLMTRHEERDTTT